MPPRLRARLLRVLSLLSILAVAACGGGEEAAGPAPPAPETGPRLAVDCSGPHCGAIDAHRYAGSGVGVWQYTNDTDDRVEVSVRIDGIPGKDVHLSYVNHSDTRQKLPPLELFLRSPYTGTAALLRAAAPAPARAGLPRPHAPYDLRALPRPRAKTASGPALARMAASASHRVGDTREWWVNDFSGGDNARAPRPTTLRRRSSLDGADRRALNIWVEDAVTAAGVITDEALDQLQERIRSTYDRITRIAGPIWAETPYENIIGAHEDLNVVIVEPLEVLGYVNFTDAYVRHYYPDFPNIQQSNEALAVYMHARSIYAPDDVYTDAIQTFSHELTHLIFWFYRGILAGDDDQLDSWLNETVAEAMKELAYHPDDAAPSDTEARFQSWLSWGQRGGFNCDLRDMYPIPLPNRACYGYSTVNALAAFLMRHYGADLLVSLLHDFSSSDSFEILDHSLRQAGGDGFPALLRRFGTSAALFPAAASPPGFGYPARHGQDVFLIPLDGARYADINTLPGRVPLYLEPYGFFPFVRPLVQGSYRETLLVPPRSSLSLVIR
ncbi:MULTISPECIES: M30 family zinc metallopeptidase [Pigmentiphaga]|uniref:Peptidase M30-like protein n=1 Tax=Pigmentiphaga daeguensis TaxID=414049 RepID=A0ABN1CNB4_9BURK|nr:hypothetical protein [Pigmentiphaga sp. NML030171]